MKRALHTVLILAVLFCLYISAAASGSVDQTFNPVASKALTYSSAMGLTVQSDGKTLIWGVNYVVDGQAKGALARLNTDGSADNTFSYCGCLLSSISTATVQADGKILLAGTDSVGLPKIVRVNADGSADGTYLNGLTGSGFQYGTATIFAIQVDGKALVSAFGGVGSGYHQGFLARLNLDGSNDNTFTHIVYDGGRLITSILRSVAIDADGKIYTAVTTFSGGQSNSNLHRYMTTGAVDGVWEIPVVSNTSGFGTDVQSLDVDTSGKLVMGGRFDRVNGVDSLNLARIMPAGNLDLTFNRPASLSGIVTQVKNVAGDKILISSSGKLYRLNSDGSIDNTFVFPSSTTSTAYDKFVVNASGQITFFAQSATSQINLYRISPDSGIDTTFQPNIAAFAQVSAVARQSDDKVILAGNFTHINGAARTTIARVNADGTLDTSFNGGTGFNTPPTFLLIQSDGKILAAGNFSTYNGISQSSLLRLNTDGSLDTAFTPTVNGVRGMSLQSDGRILVFGSFTTVNGVSKTAAARLETNGTLDASFNVLFSAGATVNSMLRLADGKFIAGGTFAGVDGFNRPNLVRLNSNGSLDQTFNATGLSSVQKIVVQPDGKFIILTSFSLSRRNSDGMADTAYGTHLFSIDNGNTSLSAAVLQSDGSVILGGEFNTVDAIRRNHIVRFSSAGELDLLFLPTGTDQRVNSLVMQSDGKVLAGGDFTRIDTSVRTGIARIIPGGFSGTTPFDFDGDGKADFAVLRPSTTYWYLFRSSDGLVATQQFYVAGDIAAPADYDGDGKTDYGVFRPSTGDWWYFSSINGGTYGSHWGQSGDIPEPADVDGDGRADFRVYRPSTGVWYTWTQVGSSSSAQFGIATDKPVNGDFNGDGKSDPAIFRPSTGDWWFRSSIDSSQRAFHWGQTGDIPATADFDGDGKSDCAVFRPSERIWYILNSRDLSITYLQFGLSDDKPVPADYDGDGKADVAVFRPSSGTWYVWGSTSGFYAMQFGADGDVPAPNAFVP